MTAKFFVYLSTVACCLLGLADGTGAVTKDVDVVVTHAAAGALITTATIKNNSASTWTAGRVYVGGQGFRRGDLPPGTYPIIRDAITHTALVHQWDEVATRNTNGDDGSWRHAVYSIRLPSNIAAGATYQAEFVRQTGTYSASAKQTLSALAAAHDLKIRFTDFRNQDGSVRGSGAATFSVNANIGNTGVDSPRKCATGPVRDCWIVMGKPVDDVNGTPDTEIYVQFYLDLTTSASNQTSLGDVRYVPAVMSPWQNTPNPYQDLSYYPQVLDGSNVVLDWSNLNQTFRSSSNPVNTSTGYITVPTSTGTNSFYTGQLDSSPENRRQKEFNNRRAKVRRQGDRRSVEWLCRRDGRRLRACWPACDGCQGSGESGYWRAGRRAVCERTGRAGRPEPL